MKDRKEIETCPTCGSPCQRFRADIKPPAGVPVLVGNGKDWDVAVWDGDAAKIGLNGWRPLHFYAHDWQWDFDDIGSEVIEWMFLPESNKEAWGMADEASTEKYIQENSPPRREIGDISPRLAARDLLDSLKKKNL